MVNKIMISVHLFNYIVLAIADILTIYVPTDNVIAVEISYISRIAVYTVCNVIFALILN